MVDARGLGCPMPVVMTQQAAYAVVVRKLGATVDLADARSDATPSTAVEFAAMPFSALFSFAEVTTSPVAHTVGV